jgi:hypothetical protein
VYYESTGVIEVSYYFSKFTTSHAYCNVTSYTLDNDNNPASIGAPVHARFNPSCVTEYGSLCQEVLLKANFLGKYSFWVVVDGHGGMQKTFEVKVEIKCGVENVTVTGSGPSLAWDRNAENAPNRIWNFVSDLPSIWNSFSIDSTLCPITKLELWYDISRTKPVYDNVTLYYGFNPPLSYLGIVSDEPILKKFFYVFAFTDSGRNNYTTFEYTVCGFE